MELNYNSIKKIDGLDEYLKQRTIPDATFRNWNSYSNKVDFAPGVDVMEAFNLLPDPQTNGGLLIAVNDMATIKKPSFNKWSRKLSHTHRQMYKTKRESYLCDAVIFTITLCHYQLIKFIRLQILIG